MRNGLFIYESPETIGAEVTICSRRLEPARGEHGKKVQARTNRYSQRTRRARMICKREKLCDLHYRCRSG